MVLPVFLVIAGLIVMTQPRTKRWQSRMSAHLGHDERRIKQRANTFRLLGLGFILTALSIWVRS
ncbi:hypothetical protein [Brevibacillus dissolubilis]|uniref:hypothetical protein n=1 Tax=Brevibacillus dissolubilis TaxID=1844116 RepID=UPI001116FDA4|nr:hypothetical protein [Brevibacillus dissolubilis]